MSYVGVPSYINILYIFINFDAFIIYPRKYGTSEISIALIDRQVKNY